MGNPRQNTGGLGPVVDVVGRHDEYRPHRNAEGDLLGTKVVAVLELACGHAVDAKNKKRPWMQPAARCASCPVPLLGTRRNRQQTRCASEKET